MRTGRVRGFTLIETVLGSLVLLVALTAIIGAYLGQVTLNEHARNVSLAVQDANRVIEQIRQSNSGAACVTPNACPPAGVGGCGTNWDTWLATPAAAAGGGGKSIPNGAANERIVVTCQTQAGGLNYCGAGQAAAIEGVAGQPDANPPEDPMLVTVTVCWRHRGRIIGECTGAAALAPSEAVVVTAPDDAALIQSPVMLTTLVTCRG